jgi:hypothetical protein
MSLLSNESGYEQDRTQLPSKNDGTDFDQETCGRSRNERCDEINGRCEQSERKPPVAMVQSADLRDGDGFPGLARLHRPLLRQSLAGERCVRVR